MCHFLANSMLHFSWFLSAWRCDLCLIRQREDFQPGRA
jgi:hypothetical protein